MIFYKKVTIFLIILFHQLPGMSQSIEKPSQLYGKILEMDTVNRKLIFENIYSGGNKYFHDIFHIKIATNTKDTLIVALVYNIRRDKDSVMNDMGLKLHAPYIFFIVNFKPCNSNFPYMFNCNCDNAIIKCELNPSSGKIFKKPYSEISRVFDFVRIDEKEWEKLL